MFAEDFPEGVVRIAPGKRMIHTPQEERKAFAQMAQDDFQVGMVFEHAGEYEANPEGGRFDGETPAGVNEGGVVLKMVFQLGAYDGRVR